MRKPITCKSDKFFCKDLTIYVNYDKIFSLTHIMWNLKGDFTMKKDLRSKLKAVCRKQRRERWKQIFGGIGNRISVLFSNITPRYYRDLIKKLDKEEFIQLQNNILSPKAFWGSIDDELISFIINEILDVDVASAEEVQKIFTYIPITAFNSCNFTTLAAILKKLEFQQQAEIWETMDEERLSNFLEMTNVCEVLCDFLDKAGTSDDFMVEGLKQLYEIISKLPAKHIAKIIENVESDKVIYTLGECTQSEKMTEACELIPAEKRYEALEKSDFLLLDNMKGFLLDNLHEQTIADLYENLQERGIGLSTTFDTSDIFAFYEAVEESKKEYILFYVLNEEQFKELYEQIRGNARMQMLEIMVGRKAIGSYSEKEKLRMQQNVIGILEQQKKLSYFEELVLNSLKK